MHVIMWNIGNWFTLPAIFFFFVLHFRIVTYCTLILTHSFSTEIQFRKEAIRRAINIIGHTCLSVSEFTVYTSNIILNFNCESLWQKATFLRRIYNVRF